MTKEHHKYSAQNLRRSGMSIREIAKTVGVSKGSVSLWCKNISLTAAQKQELRTVAVAAGAAGRLKGAQKNRQLKIDALRETESQGRLLTQKLSSREALLVGVALYWGEGSKVGQLSFINSDKDMVLFMYRWFRFALNVAEKDFMPRIYINQSHQSRKSVIESYWSNLTGIPIDQFRSTVFINRDSKKRFGNHDTYYGLLSLRVRNSTRLKYRILGLIQGLKYSTFR